MKATVRYVIALLGVCVSASVSMSVSAETLTDQLLAQLLNKHLPAPLYQRGDNSWPGGSYRLEVFQQGQPVVQSGDTDIHVRLPLKMVITGIASSDLLGFKFNCSASFQTTGTVELTPANASGGISGAVLLRSAVTVPIPPVTADCGTVQLPIDSYLKTFVAQNKRQWELRIDREINAQLAE